MEKVATLKIAVITPKKFDESEIKSIKKNIGSFDNTFGVLGTGGYKVKYDAKKNRFIFTQCDCAPAKRFVAYLKDATIECQFEILGEIALAVAKSDISFCVDTKEVEGVFVP